MSTEIEERLAYLERPTDELSAVVARQGSEIDGAGPARGNADEAGSEREMEGRGGVILGDERRHITRRFDISIPAQKWCNIGSCCAISLILYGLLAKEIRHAIPRPSRHMQVGHVHLKVSDLERSIAWYCDVLGLDVMQRYGDQAAFLSAGGYHHHLGLNTWDSRGGAQPADGTRGCTTRRLFTRTGQVLAAPSSTCEPKASN